MSRSVRPSLQLELLFFVGLFTLMPLVKGLLNPAPEFFYTEKDELSKSRVREIFPRLCVVIEAREPDTSADPLNLSYVPHESSQEASSSIPELLTRL
jgi:hypothetical protein